MHKAAAHGELPKVLLLLKAGADPKKKTAANAFAPAQTAAEVVRARYPQFLFIADFIDGYCGSGSPNHSGTDFSLGKQQQFAEDASGTL